MTQFSNRWSWASGGFGPVGWAAYNAVPDRGGAAAVRHRLRDSVDADQSVLPAEAGQFDRAVSVTKGCYLGQEIVARMHARQQVAKQLVGLRVKADASADGGGGSV